MTSGFSKTPLSQQRNWRTIKKIPDVNFWPLDMWKNIYTIMHTTLIHATHTHTQSIVCVYLIFLVCSFGDVHLWWLHRWLLCKHRFSGICSILTQIPVGIYLEVVQLDHVIILFLIFEEHSSWFLHWLHYFTGPLEAYKGSFLPSPSLLANVVGFLLSFSLCLFVCF